MAAKLKKRLSKIENKLLKLDKLELKDLICSICHSILIEPVTLPCYHDFCQHCFNGSIENNALCCPLCRLRIGSWIRAATKQKNLVNVELWNFIKSKFSKEIKIKTKGEDLSFPEEKPPIRLSAPGEIRLEYEAELKRLRFERLQLEQKQFQETEFLIKKIQQEEEEAHKKYLDALKQDEILAQQIQGANLEQKAPKNLPRKQNLRGTINKKVKAAKIDSYLAKLQAPVIIRNSPLLTDDNTSTDSSTPKVPSVKQNNRDSPEIVSSYGKFLKNLIDKKIRNRTGIWNKENGDTLKDKEIESENNSFKEDGIDDKNIKSKNGIQSLLVSLPLPHPGVLQHKTNASKNRSTETDSFDSTQQELCYFKPIEGTTPISLNSSKRLPLRVPGMHVGHKGSSLQHEVAPSRAQYIEGLCRLRNLSMAENLPSAFVIALNILRVKKDTVKCETNIQLRDKKVIPSGPCLVSTFPAKRSSNRNKQIIQIDGITELNTKTNLRRTRSMGCISKDENETTPKKAKLKDRKVSSEKKLCLRSNSKKSTTKKDSNSSPLIPDSVNNNKVNLAIKNLSSPLKNCDFKNILQEQLRIEKIIEQEKNDFELARKVEAEWNGRRQPRRLAVKRQLTLNYALRPSKKLKV